MSTYLFKLTPIERFFFGGSVTFGEGEKRNYFVRSLYFPQQTTLLGTLRYMLLKKQNLMDENGKVIDNKKTEAEGAIGPSGFNHSLKTGADFGKIKKLSPVFLSGPNGEEYFAQSREYAFKSIEDEITGEMQQELIPLHLKYRMGAKADHKGIGYFDNYNSKCIMPDLLVNARTGQMHYYEYNAELKSNPLNGFFVPHFQTGNMLPKNNTDENKENGFYKQVGYSLLPGFSFAFYADIENVEELEKFNSIIRMGADESYFKLEIESKGINLDSLFAVGQGLLTKNLYKQPNEKSCKLVFLSDTYLPSEELTGLDFASIDVVPFNYLQIFTGEIKEKAFKMVKAGIYLHKSEKSFNLIKKGSVLYFDSPEGKLKLLKKITEQAAFHQIGNNYAI